MNEQSTFKQPKKSGKILLGIKDLVYRRSSSLIFQRKLIFFFIDGISTIMACRSSSVQEDQNRQTMKKNRQNG